MRLFSPLRHSLVDFQLAADIALLSWPLILPYCIFTNSHTTPSFQPIAAGFSRCRRLAASHCADARLSAAAEIDCIDIYAFASWLSMVDVA
jgi:hypothetical protein